MNMYIQCSMFIVVCCIHNTDCNNQQALQTFAHVIVLVEQMQLKLHVSEL